MDEPVCAQRAPYAVDVKPGDYYWCACGRSKGQPFCDCSHTGTGYSPMQFTVTEPKKVYLCGCKRSKKAPFCDGTHKSL